MKLLLFTFISLFFFVFEGLSNEIKDYLAFPKLESILKHFQENYKGADEEHYIDFTKQSDGYHVLLRRYSDEKISDDQLYWSLETKTFLPLNNAYSEVNNTFNPSHYLSRSYAFDHALFYNYEGASDESINALSKFKKLPEILTEALARAYSEKTDLIAGGKKVERNNAPMEKSEMEHYLIFAHKTLETYKRLEKQNPYYETIVGPVHTKYNNECMNFWFELNASGYVNEANSFLKNANYGSFMIDFAKNILTTCEPNAIFFTFGDNDTYPLWFVQEKLNYRKDVAVFNYGLSQINFYNQFLLRHYNLTTYLSAEDYSNDLLKLVKVKKIKEKNLQIPEFLNLLSLANINNLESIPNSNYKSIVYSNLKIGLANGDTARISLGGGDYYLADFFTLDLIGKYARSRPIHFADYYGAIASSTTDKVTHLMSFELKKTTGQLRFSKSTKSFENLEDNYTLFTEKLIFQNNYKKEEINYRILFNYTVIGASLANNLVLANQKDKAKELLTYLEKALPINSLKNGGSIALYLAQIWFELEDDLHTKFYVEATLSLLEKSLNESEVNQTEVLYTLNYLEEFCMKNNLDFIDQIKAVRVKI